MDSLLRRGNRAQAGFQCLHDKALVMAESSRDGSRTARLVAKAALIWIVLITGQVSGGVGRWRNWAGRLARSAWRIFNSGPKPFCGRT